MQSHINVTAIFMTYVTLIVNNVAPSR